MKKYIKKCLLICLLVFAFMHTGTYNSLAAQNLPVEKRGTIAVNTSANKDLVPDTAELIVKIETNDNRSLQNATLKNKEISEKIYGELQNLINSTNGDYVKTSNFSASPVYKRSGTKNVLDTYKVYNNIIVRTKSLDKLGQMIDNSIALGATGVQSLNFSVSKYDIECEALLSEASKKGYLQAQSVLKAANTDINGVSSINASCGGNNIIAPRRMQIANKSFTLSQEDAEPAPSFTVIEAGTLKINANVNAVYFVK